MPKARIPSKQKDNAPNINRNSK